ncbi:helix-turn-helix transcriptional regulator [Castellaniella sp. FW104-16D08]|uniref:helix-turn-helix domain-containing protein n=1 Tax=unclassified Castellaniella TaxID=2617606 RepID=UPI003314AF97
MKAKTATPPETKQKTTYYAAASAQGDQRRMAALKRARRQVAAALPKDTKFPLTRLRLQAGLSQADLAKLLDTHQPAIARLENGASDPRFTTIKKLATALGVSEAEVLEAIDAGRVASQISRKP